MQEEKTISFPIIFNHNNGKTNTSKSSKSINECLFLLINATKNEMLGDPNYGADLMSNAFDFSGNILEEILRNKILTSISLYEKRIEVSNNDITFETNDNIIIISINYFIIQEGVYGTYSLAMLKGEE